MVLADHKTHQTGMPRRDFNEAAEEGWIQAAQQGSVPCLWAKLSVLLFLQDVCMAPGLAHGFDRTSLVLDEGTPSHKNVWGLRLFQ